MHSLRPHKVRWDDPQGGVDGHILRRTCQTQETESCQWYIAESTLDIGQNIEYKSGQVRTMA